MSQKIHMFIKYFFISLWYVTVTFLMWNVDPQNLKIRVCDQFTKRIRCFDFPKLYSSKVCAFIIQTITNLLIGRSESFRQCEMNNFKQSQCCNFSRPFLFYLTESWMTEHYCTFTLGWFIFNRSSTYLPRRYMVF